VIAAATATVAAIAIDLVRYQDFLLLLGSFFVPLFGVLLADWLLAGRYTERDIFGRPGLPGRADLRLAGGLRLLPVAPSRRPLLVGSSSWTTPPARARHRREPCRAWVGDPR
jgi:purine-cytosine permease-like protein